ncbi:DRAP deaminase [Coemansia sp. RSA 2618]|nr:DRAP deaminase [Coemansia sp. RSA 2618]
MKIHCIAILSRQGNPIYLHNYDNYHTDIKYHYLAHTSTDVIAERLLLEQKTTDPFLGLLQTVGDMVVHAYVMNTGKQILVVSSVAAESSSTSSSTRIRQVCQGVHAAYVALVCNPFDERREEERLQTITLGQKCINTDRAFNVGAVIADQRTGSILSTGYSRELPGNTHAEQCALTSLNATNYNGNDLAIYTTMEPCSRRLSGNKPCVERIVEAGISKVFVGVREPSNFVVCTGVAELEKRGVRVVVIEELESECRELNRHLG